VSEHDDWVLDEAEALLDATPGLREDLRAAMDELHAGTLQDADAATARARIEARISRHPQHDPVTGNSV
jgi:hypothetical protein